MNEYSSVVQNFSADLFKKCVKTDQSRNFLISPLSVLYALGMAANGAGGKTREEFGKLFEASPQELSQYLHTYIQSLRDDSTLKAANALWFNKNSGLTLFTDFVKSSEENFDALLSQEVFSSQSAENINSWVKEKTGGMIQRLLDSVSEYDVLYLLNALAFDGKWANQHYKEIFEGRFTTREKVIKKAKMMSFDENLYLEDSQATGFVKYYSGRRFSFIALLPKKLVRFEKYIEGLTGEKIQNMLSSAWPTKTYVEMPVFTCQSEINNIKKALEEMGMGTAFSEKADFSKMLMPASRMDSSVKIDRIMQKTFISVDEHGTKAAAITFAGVAKCYGISSEPEPKRVILNRPFVYMIYDHEMNIPVFMGTLTDVGEKCRWIPGDEEEDIGKIRIRRFFS